MPGTRTSSLLPDPSAKQPESFLTLAQRITHTSGAPLTPYQLTCSVAVASGVVRIIVWAIGSGKTLLAIATLLLLRSRRASIRMLVIAPKTLTQKWADDVADYGLTSFILRNGKQPLPADVDVVIAPATSLLTSRRDDLLAWVAFGFVVLDEAHAFKSIGAKRTIAVYGKRLDGMHGIVEKAYRIIAMSGSFSPNNNSELYTHLRCLEPRAITDEGAPRPLSYYEFCDRFVVMVARGPSRVMVAAASKNIEELRTMVAPYLNVVTQDMVQSAMPEVRHDAVRLHALDVNFDHGAALAEVVDPLVRAKLMDIERAMETATEAEIDVLVKRFLRESGQDHHLSRMRRAMGLAKVGWLKEYLDGRAKNGRPVLVFNIHIQVGDAIENQITAAGYRVARIYGDTSDAGRASAVARIKAGTVDVGLLQLQAASEGLDLQSADTVIMLEPSWSPGQNDQAIGRSARMGQRSAVQIIWPVIKGTVDEIVLRVIRRKEADSRRLWS